MDLAHIHLLLNHWPIIGSFIGLGLFGVAVIANSDHLKQASLALFALLALLAVPTYMSGNLAQDVIKNTPGLSTSLIETHEGAALLSLLFLEITGFAALVGLWRFSRISGPLPGPVARWDSVVVLVFSIVTVCLMVITGNTGGAIRHPEILSGQDSGSALATLTGAMGSKLIAIISYWVVDYSRWMWGILEIFHFFGLILIIATVGALNLRILGFFKELPVAPLHRLLPWGIAGLIINMATGTFFFLGMRHFYVHNLGYHLKMLAILIAGGNLLVFNCTGAFTRLARLGPGEEAPALDKVIAGSSIFLWFAIIVLGRFLPFFEGSL